MKRIFDRLREQTETKINHYKEKADYIWDEELSAFNQGISKGMRIARKLIDEAEAKWEVEKKWERCEWKLEDAEANLYVTSCEQQQLIFEGTPKENEYKYCPYCGRKILEVE